MTTRFAAASVLRWTTAGLLALVAAACSQGSPPAAKAPDPPASWPSPQWPLPRDAAMEARIDGLLASMRLEEKVGQVIQGDISTVTPEDVRRYYLGSVLNGGGSGPGGDDFAPPEKWLALADAFHAASVDKTGGRAGIPVMWGTDAMHGHSNIVGATLFPHNIGLGATHSPELLARIAGITAEQVRTTGMDWTFAPTVTVPQDDRWGRTYEGFSEDPELVASYAGVFVRGLQGDPAGKDFLGGRHVISSVKHFVGDGGTAEGVDQGDAQIGENVLRDVHAAGYPPAIEAGVQTVMVSYSSWSGVKNHGNRYLLTDVLKGRMNFDGFIVGDWNGHGQVPGCKVDDCPQAINAGLDMYMAPDSWKGLYGNLLAQARNGTVPMSRLDDAVRRILRVKIRAGLFEQGPPSSRVLAGDFERLWSPEAREVAREAVRRSLVLLKNDGGLLPLSPGARVLVTGDGADNIGKQSGGWTISWQGSGLTNANFPHGTSIWKGIRQAVEAGGGQAELSATGAFTRKPDVAIVVFGEDPYAEMLGDRKVLGLPVTQSAQLGILKRLREQGIPVVSILISGRPLWVNRELNASQAFVAAWLPGTEGAGLSDVLFRARDGSIANDFKGRLSYSWPRDAGGAPLNAGQTSYAPLFALGYGMDYSSAPSQRASPLLPEDSGASAELLNAGTFLEVGAAVEPWRLVVTGETVMATPVSDGVQQVAQRFTARAGAPASVVIEGERGVDFTRETNGDVMLLLRLRREGPIGSDTQIGMSCGGKCGGAVTVGAQLAVLPARQWRTVGLSLKCLAAAGVDMTQVRAPLSIASQRGFDLTLARVQLGTNPDLVLTCGL